MILEMKIKIALCGEGKGGIKSFLSYAKNICVHQKHMIELI